MARQFGEGGVYLRGSTYWLRFSVNGREHRESSGSDDRKVATRTLRKRLSEVAAGQFAPDAAKLDFPALVDLVRADYRVNGRRSGARLETAITHLADTFSEHKARAITSQAIVEYVSNRTRETAAPSSIRNELACLRRAFNLALAQGLVATKPRFPTVAVNNARSGFFTAGEVDALCLELAPELRGIVRMGWLTGWRMESEIFALRWSAIDSANVLRIAPGVTKGGEGREIPLGSFPQLAAVIAEQRAYTDRVERETGSIIPYIFHRDGAPILSIRNAWNRARDAAGLPNHIPHDLRRSAVRNLERAGVPRSVAKGIVGHKTDAMYSRYAIVDSRDVASGVAQLAAMHSITPPEPRTVTALNTRTVTESRTKGVQKRDSAAKPKRRAAS